MLWGEIAIDGERIFLLAILWHWEPKKNNVDCEYVLFTFYEFNFLASWKSLEVTGGYKILKSVSSEMGSNEIVT